LIENRFEDYLDHMRQAATDACTYVEGLQKDDFLDDKRTQQAVTMSVITGATFTIAAYVQGTGTSGTFYWK
jgi:uncharacterized protein with HEPN domain